ncbi:MAG: hypothetical protein Q7S57_04625 [bacterium]|nr:hypothetical protein [bacterium]
MKNLQYIRQAQYKKGFIGALFLVIVALLVAVGGTYFYMSKKTGAPSPANAQDSNSIKNETAITFITPVESESLIRGISHVVIWDGTYSGELTLKVLSTPIGSKISSVVADNVLSPNKRNQIVWDVPCNFDSSQAWYKLVLTDKKTGAVIANSPNFIISKNRNTTCSNSPASITVLSPNGGESYQAGSVQSIKWNGGKNPLEIMLETYSEGELVVVGSIATNVNPSVGQYMWKVGDIFNKNSSGTKIFSTVPVGKYFIRVNDFMIGNLDRSDTLFTITN